MRLVLKAPIPFGEQGPPISELVFREEVCAGDMRGLKVNSLADPTTDDILKIAGRLCAQPDAVMSKLKMADFLEVVGLVASFIKAGQETGTAT